MAGLGRRRKKPETDSTPVLDAAQVPPAPSMIFYPDDHSGEPNLGQLDISMGGNRYTVDFHGPRRGIYRATGFVTASNTATGQINVNDPRAITRISVPQSRAEDDLITAAANLASKARNGNITLPEQARFYAVLQAIESGHAPSLEAIRAAFPIPSPVYAVAPAGGDQVPVVPQSPASPPIDLRDLGRLF